MTIRQRVFLCFFVPIAIAGTASAQTPAELLLRAPTPNTVVTGSLTFAADVNPIAVPVREVAFFVDGQPACTVRVRPFECSWDAGSRSIERTIRVVADLSNGQRLVTTMRTKAADRSTPIFRASASAVAVPVRVTDSRNRVVAGLSADRFRLLEDGVPQQIEAILQSDAPASVLLCLDASSSMTSVLSELKRATVGFLDALRPQDTVAMAVFNTSFYVLARPDATAPARRASLERIRPTGGTALFDSLIRAVALIRAMPSPRAVVVFTDGMDSDSRASVETVRAAFQANDIVLYLVVQGEPPLRDSSGGRLARLAQETGGSAWFARRISTLSDQFAGIVGDLVNRYVLVYSPHRPLGDDAWRSITVEVTGATDGYAVRAREGYVASRRDGDVR
jgi:VWFA-related protein